MVFLSAHDDAGAKRQAFEAGGIEYLVKPFEAAEVLARVAHHLELSTARREVEAQRATLSSIRARADATFTALCSILPGVTLDQRYLLGVLTSGGPRAAVFEATRLETGEAVSLRVIPPWSGAGPLNHSH